MASQNSQWKASQFWFKQNSNFSSPILYKIFILYNCFTLFQGLSRSNLPPFLGRFFLVYCITTERLFPPFIFKENAIKTSADTAKSISRGLEGIFHLLLFVAFIFAAFISRFTSSDVSSRHLPCGNMPSFTAPTAVRFSLATSRPSCSHIFRICRFRPS